MFIMNLAAADLLVLVFCLPATVVQDVTKTWFFGLILCKFVNYIQVMTFEKKEVENRSLFHHSGTVEKDALSIP